MIETNLNMFDTAVIVIMALSCLIAFFRGLVKEILSLIAWIGAAFITMHYFAPVMEKMKSHFTSEAMAAGVTVMTIYIAALFCFSLVNWMIIKAIKQGGDAGMLDNMLGLGFGALRGAFIVSLGFFLITIMLPGDEKPAWLKDSITRPYVEKGAALLAEAAPESLQHIASLTKKAAERSGAQLDEDESAEKFEQVIESSRPAR